MKQKTISRAHEIKKEVKEIQKETVNKLTTLLTAAFGLVAALAWNEAIKKIFEIYVKPAFGIAGEMWSMIIYAVVVTIFIVIITMWISKLSAK